MTITEFREELDRLLKDAENTYKQVRCRGNNDKVVLWYSRFHTLQDIKTLAEQLNGEV